MSKASDKSKQTVSKGVSYIPKRTLQLAGKRAGTAAAERAMQVMGYAIVQQGNWIVRVNQDGSTKKISRVI